MWSSSLQPPPFSVAPPNTYLQNQLCMLAMADPFLVTGSEQVVEYLSTQKRSQCFDFSIDVTDLFCSIPHARRISWVKQ